MQLNNNGGYLLSRKAAREISNTLHAHCGEQQKQWIASTKIHVVPFFLRNEAKLARKIQKNAGR